MDSSEALKLLACTPIEDPYAFPEPVNNDEELSEWDNIPTIIARNIINLNKYLASTIN